ncbi:hypothetical protein GUITHDRAFT_110000 [Guillardia theta CCMP2712]|uniref:non-specific serine/threonine protein kinase n=1 Tax=Guillardia theta (strain CCMP2712) TaxID=905079 RepID=L1J7Y9_GUITC|nr:hypothetical protein GUITHDRAFT_110000 [Guillardia theta CCMP2712]EKX44214.1 hypothetical protein GUITHDRAFT_110000 [Guillardia theta CCMP2712]|eukprot:XP_005831194.1 hypothetical protein GUITHDRAFT_110000 [Guillardia theta CCMP2712]
MNKLSRREDGRRSVPVSRLTSSLIAHTRRSHTVVGFHDQRQEGALQFREVDYAKQMRELLERSNRMHELTEEYELRKQKEKPAGIDEYETRVAKECDEMFSRYTFLDPGSLSAAAQDVCQSTTAEYRCASNGSSFARTSLSTTSFDEMSSLMQMAKYETLRARARRNSETLRSRRDWQGSEKELPQVHFGTSLSFKKHREQVNPNGMRDLRVGIEVVKAYSIIHMRSVISSITSKSQESTQHDYERLRKYLEKVKSATVMKHFTFLGLFGKRQFAETRHCRHNDTGIHVAIDIMKKSELEEMHMADKITRQLMLLKDLRHPNVVEFIGVIDTKNLLLQVMEPLYGDHTILAVDYIHSCGVIHRDVNPANLVLDHLGHLKLTSFSCAKKTFGRRCGSMVGSPQYQAPEVGDRMLPLPVRHG